MLLASNTHHIGSVYRVIIQNIHNVVGEAFHFNIRIQSSVGGTDLANYHVYDDIVPYCWNMVESVKGTFTKIDWGAAMVSAEQAATQAACQIEYIVAEASSIAPMVLENAGMLEALIPLLLLLLI